MGRPGLLSEIEIQENLKDIPLWKRSENAIVREFVAPDFVSAMGFVNAIAIIAEAMDHHPDILIYGWNKIRITTTTHDRGGLTKLDFELAKKIDNLKFFK